MNISANPVITDDPGTNATTFGSAKMINSGANPRSPSAATRSPKETRSPCP